MKVVLTKKLIAAIPSSPKVNQRAIMSNLTPFLDNIILEQLICRLVEQLVGGEVYEKHYEHFIKEWYEILLNRRTVPFLSCL